MPDSEQNAFEGLVLSGDNLKGARRAKPSSVQTSSKASDINCTVSASYGLLWTAMYGMAQHQSGGLFPGSPLPLSNLSGGS
jgi:hypothetical protein